MSAKRWVVVVVAAVVVVAGLVALAVRAGGSDTENTAADSEPAAIEPIKGSDVKQVTLSADAARRLGIETARISPNKVIPVAAVLYDSGGATFTYISPERLVFMRSPISVERIERGKAFLSKSPPAGTSVVTVGSQELFGAEYGVEED
jgi:hypothetical protein